MKVSPPRGTGFRGDEIDSRVRANWSVLTDEPAFVTLDGFVFESPGFCGVWVRRGGVTVSNCRFLGCRTGVPVGIGLRRSRVFFPTMCASKAASSANTLATRM